MRKTVIFITNTTIVISLIFMVYLGATSKIYVSKYIIVDKYIVDTSDTDSNWQLLHIENKYIQVKRKENTLGIGIKAYLDENNNEYLLYNGTGRRLSDNTLGKVVSTKGDNKYTELYNNIKSFKENANKDSSVRVLGFITTVIIMVASYYFKSTRLDE